MIIFKIVVENCRTCPYADPKDKHGEGWCNMYNSEQYKKEPKEIKIGKIGVDSFTIYAENEEMLTQSCPMWDKREEID